MTTPLLNALKREVHIAGEPYRVTINAEGLSLVRKGMRKSVTYTWEALLHSEAEPEREPTAASTRHLSRAILTELAQDIRAAAGALTKAEESLTQAGAMPERLLTASGGDPLSGNARQQEHWFVEPLLTMAEVAAILRVSTRTVRRLPIGTMPINGEVRYLQSAVREYLKNAAVPAPRTRGWR